MASRRRKKRKASLAARHGAAPDDRKDEAARARRALRMVVVFYLFLAGAYAIGIPLGKGPDETAHVRYIEFLVKNHRLPVFDPANPDPDYEFHQPPLYYVISLPTYLLAAKDTDTAQQAVRLFTLLLSLSLLYLTFALGRALVPAHPWVPVSAAAVVAFLPMHLSLSTSIGNDLLAEILATTALLLLILYLRASALYRARQAERPPGPPLMAGVGVIIGLGMLTKSIAVLLFPVAWVAAALAARRPGGYAWRQLARDAALTTGIALLLSGWWLVRNHSLYGDPLAQRAFLEAFQGLRPSPQDFMRRYEASLPEYVGQVIMWTLASILGVFGPVRSNRFVFFPTWTYIAYGLLGVAGTIGFSRYLSKERLADWQRQSWWVCALLGGLLLASFVRFNFSFFQAQARYLFPVLPAAAVALCLGMQELFPARWRAAALLATPILLILLSLILLPLWILPQFRIP